MTMVNRFEAQPKYTQFVQNTSAAAIDDARYKLSAARHVLNMFAEYYVDCPEEKYLSLCATMQPVFSQQIAAVVNAIADVEQTLLIARSLSDVSAVPAPAGYADGGIPLPSSDTSLAPGNNSEGFGF